MQKIVLRGKPVVEGVAEGEALVTKASVTFFGTMDYATGTIVAPSDHELKGQSVAGKILVFRAEVGATAEPLGYYLLKKAGRMPKALVCATPGQMPVVCSIIGNTPFVYNLDRSPIDIIKTGDQVKVDGNRGVVEIQVQVELAT
jgi:predicted aconitase with swiveling domain